MGTGVGTEIEMAGTPPALAGADPGAELQLGRRAAYAVRSAVTSRCALGELSAPRGPCGLRSVRGLTQSRAAADIY